jgi:hypothetical protein
MESNIPAGGWRVKMVPIPASITVTQLAETIDLPNSRIYFPNVEETNIHYACINDFYSKEEANKFAHQWSGSSIFDETIKCIIVAPENEETADTLHSSCEPLEYASDSVQRKQRESRFNKEVKRRQDNSDLPNRSASLRSSITNISNTLINDMQKKSSSHYFHQSLNRQQQRLTSNQVPQQTKTLGKLFYAHN